jgi:hypothetical protein
MSKVISFRASGHFLDWLEAQRMEEESLSQCCPRMLRVMSAGGVLTGVSTKMSTKVSTLNTPSILSTKLSTFEEKMQTVFSEIELRFTQTGLTQARYI